jgi:succinoglycan biosynthesis transport protein ExoP
MLDASSIKSANKHDKKGIARPSDSSAPDIKRGSQLDLRAMLSQPDAGTAPQTKLLELTATSNVAQPAIRSVRNVELMRYVVQEPLSSFAEAFRAIKIAADIGGSIGDNKVIGVTSILPREGKSTASSNLAQLIADAGKKAILIDGDLRNPTLTRSLSPDAKIGLLEVLAKKIPLADAIYHDAKTGLSFLPSVLEAHLAHTDEILASNSFSDLMGQLRKIYDFIIVDFAPLAPVVDVRATTRVVDSYVFVVEWGKTRVNLVQSQLESAPEIYDKLLGVILNKANVRVLERYEQYYGKYYYKRYYGRYGYGS